MTAMANTGMISILSLQKCIFSAVDPLDPSMSPVSFAMGQTVGQYYRGSLAVSGLVYFGGALLIVAMAFFMQIALDKEDSFAFLRFPSIMMIAVSIFHQGTVMCGASLLFLHDAWRWDAAIGAAAIATAVATCCIALLATTKFLSCQLEDRQPSKEAPPLAYEKKLSGLLKISMWNQHWMDGSVRGYKRRFLLLLDDLRCPWWTTAELSSGLVQGLIIGVRRSDLSVCRIQLIALSCHCAIMFLAVCVVRPTGSLLGNVFLVASKLASLLVALLELAYVFSDDNESLIAASGFVTTGFTILSSLQAAMQLFTTGVIVLRALSRKWNEAHAIHNRRFSSAPVLVLREDRKSGIDGEKGAVTFGDDKHFEVVDDDRELDALEAPLRQEASIAREETDAPNDGERNGADPLGLLLEGPRGGGRSANSMSWNLVRRLERRLETEQHKSARAISSTTAAGTTMEVAPPPPQAPSSHHPRHFTEKHGSVLAQNDANEAPSGESGVAVPMSEAELLELI